MSTDHILFQNRFLAVIERDGYTFSREVRCQGIIVSILPFRVVAGASSWEFLARLEICPAHGPELEYCSITGGLDPELSVEATAIRELLEEAGYRAEAFELIPLGIVRPSKSADTTVYLFAVDVTGKASSTPRGDGSRFEMGASVEWVTYEWGVHIADPLFVTAMTRLQTLNQPKGR
jgi:8-oxo-dGTP pyrophosphatase MutT (NUDIX family)